MLETVTMSNRRDFLRRCGALAAGTALGVTPSLSAQGTVLEGIDISQWQGTVNFATVASSGIQFIICKATEGMTFTDPKFTTNWPAIKANNMVRGAYHYGRPNTDPIAQARHFYRTVKPSSGDLPCVLDIEATDGQTPAQVRYWIQRFCQELRQRMGKPPMIYCGYYFWRDNAGNSPYNYNCPLWMPRWGVSNPFPLPSAWTNWTMWQYTATGSVPGITGNVDLDQFNGPMSALNAMKMP